MIPGIGNGMRALGECRRSNDRGIARLPRPCTPPPMQGEAQPANAPEADGTGNEISKCRDQTSSHQPGSAGTSARLRESSGMSGARTGHVAVSCRRARTARTRGMRGRSL